MERNAVRLLSAITTAVFILAAQTTGGGQTTSSAPHKVQPPRSARLYVFDCGILHIADAGRFGFKKEELATTEMSVACFLVTHPKGTLIWDTGAVPDNAWMPTGNRTTQHIVLPDLQHLHTFGGSYSPRYDRESLVDTARREPFEECRIVFDPGKIPAMLLVREPEIAFLELVLVGIGVSKEALQNAKRNAEGSLVRIKFSQLEASLT